ncbi:MAG: hypothetical protein ACI9QQ_000972 [Myxococcota bacterium]|jgi:hypothetical protein
MIMQWTKALVTTALVAAVSLTSQASAAPIGAASPDAGYGVNTGVERFTAGDQILSLELKDTYGGVHSSFGIYYEKDDLITLFGADDMGAGQSAMVDLAGGSVMDVDQNTFDFFDPKSGDFGFFFKKGTYITYSEMANNEGNEHPTSIGTYQSLTDPLKYLISFEWWDEDQQTILGLELIGGIRPSEGPVTNAVPEPSAAILFGIGAFAMHGAVRKSKR